MTPSVRHSLFEASIVLLLGGAIAAIFLTPLRSYLTLENVRAVIAQLRGVGRAHTNAQYSVMRRRISVRAYRVAG